MRYRFKLQSVNKFRVSISILSFYEMNLRKVHVIFTRAILRNTKEMFSLCPSPTLFSVSICSEHCIHCYMSSSGCLSDHVFAVKYAFWNEKPHFSFRHRNEESSQPHNSRSPLKDVYFMFWECFFALEM